MASRRRVWVFVGAGVWTLIVSWVVLGLAGVLLRERAIRAEVSSKWITTSVSARSAMRALPLTFVPNLGQFEG